MNLIISEKGNDNWDVIVKAETKSDISGGAKPGSKEEPFSLQLEKITITDATIIYNDKEVNISKKIALNISCISPGIESKFIIIHFLRFKELWALR